MEFQGLKLSYIIRRLLLMFGLAWPWMALVCLQTCWGLGCQVLSTSWYGSVAVKVPMDVMPSEVASGSSRPVTELGHY